MLFQSRSIVRVLCNCKLFKPNKLSRFPPLQSSKCHTQSPATPHEAAAEAVAANAAAACLESCSSNLSFLCVTHARMLRRRWLRSAFHYNALARCYLRHGRPVAVLLIFPHLLSSSAPDSYTFPIAFKAVAQTFTLNFGCQLHAVALKLNLAAEEFTESGLISVYSKMGEFFSARKVFDENPNRKLGSWNALINSLAQSGRSREAIDVFIELLRSGCSNDDVTMVSVASASGSLGDIHLAEQVHKCAIQAARCGRLDVMLGNALLDMYAKCGRTDIAQKLFDEMPTRDVSTWTAMISGLAMHGQEIRALELFRSMLRNSIQPNHVTFVGVLSACAHGGLVDEGLYYFKKMASDFGVRPTVAHYGCVVDMLGRVGRLAEAKEIVETMHMRGNVVIFGTILGACEKHGNVEIGKWAAEKLIELEPWNDGVYVVLANVYAAAGLWPEATRMRRLMRDKTLAKTPGYSLTTTVSN